MEQKKSALNEISVSEIVFRWCSRFTLCLKHVILVGGFAASDYLFERVEAQLTRKGLVLMRPDNRVYVLPSMFTCKLFTFFFYLETRPFLMGLFPSFLIIVFALELRRSLMELIFAFLTTNVTQSTSRGLI